MRLQFSSKHHDAFFTERHLAQGLPGVEARNVSRLRTHFCSIQKITTKRCFFLTWQHIFAAQEFRKISANADSKRSYGAVDNCYKAGGFSKVLSWSRSTNCNIWNFWSLQLFHLQAFGHCGRAGLPEREGLGFSMGDVGKAGHR